MLRGERSKTATGGDGDNAQRETVLCDTLLWAGGGDFDMKPFVRAQAEAAEAVGTATVSSSDSVKSITQSSLPLTVHPAESVGAAAAAEVVVAAGTGGWTLCGVSTYKHENVPPANYGEQYCQYNISFLFDEKKTSGTAKCAQKYNHKKFKTKPDRPR